MTKTTEIVVSEEQQQPPKPNIFSIFPKFNLQLPFLNLNPQKQNDKPTPNNNGVVPVGNQEEKEGPKPNVVRFPKTQVVVPPPIEAEAEESNTKTSNPVILWQVYALGAIFVSRWIWARWNERKARGRSPNDDRAEGRPSDDDHHRASDDE